MTAPLTAPTIPFIAAKNFTPAHRTAITWIVLHTAECTESPTGARNVAMYFANQAPGNNGSSAHYVVDGAAPEGHIFQCVYDHDIAWHAPGANDKGIGIEHAGYARQSAEEWRDDYSQRELLVSANWTATLCLKYGLPLEFVDADGVKAKRPGITTHKVITDALNGGRGHTDPGPFFPMDEYIKLVRAGVIPSPPLV